MYTFLRHLLCVKHLREGMLGVMEGLQYLDASTFSAEGLIVLDGEGIAGNGFFALLALEAILVPLHVQRNHCLLQYRLGASSAPGGKLGLKAVLTIGLSITLVE